MCSPRNDKYNPSFWKTYLSINVCYVLGFYVSADYFSQFLGRENHVFHIALFRPTRYVQKSFRYLEVRNGVRNWNKVKKIIFMGSKRQLCQLEIPIFIYKIMCQSILINSSFISVMFIYSCNEPKWLENYYFSTIIISN